MHVCTKGKCPKRFAVGSEQDDDAVNIVCTECFKVFPQSDKKTSTLFTAAKRLSIFLGIIAIGSFCYTYLYLSRKEADHITDAKDFLIAFYERGDAKDYNAQADMMHFDLDKYYDTKAKSKEEVLKFSKAYYTKVIESSEAGLDKKDIYYNGISVYPEDSSIDSIYEFYFPLTYSYKTKKKEEELILKVLTKLVRVDDEWRLKYIEELERDVLYTRTIPPEPIVEITTTSSSSSSSGESQELHVNAESTLKMFAKHMSNESWRSAYELTDNELWHPFNTFKNDAWGNLNQFSISSPPSSKVYDSDYGADQIYEMGLRAYDNKEQVWRDMLFDYHLKQTNGAWKIVRMINPKPSIEPEVTNITVYYDSDRDGYGNEFNSKVSSSAAIPYDYAIEYGDCDDSDPNVHPGILRDGCNGVDDDCDGLTDEDCGDKDTDGDGVTNTDDLCPERFSSSADTGCPEHQLDEPTVVLYYGERTEIILRDELGLKPTDVFNWSIPKANIIGSTNSAKCVAVFPEVGAYSVDLTISNNSDNFYEEIVPGKVFARIKESELSKHFKNIAEIGNYGLIDNPESISQEARASEIFIKSILSNPNISVVSGNGRTSGFSFLINKLKTAKRSFDTRIKFVNISKISYDETTGKIDKLHYSII